VVISARETSQTVVPATEVQAASASIPINKNKEDMRAARIALVEQPVRLENAHGLEGVLRTFGSTARYDDEAWGEHDEGGVGVRQSYEPLMKAPPDLEIAVVRRHVPDDAVLLEVMIRGTHLGDWRGLPATGGESRCRFAGCTHLTPRTGWREKKSITTGGTVLPQLGRFPRPAKCVGPAVHFSDASGDDCEGAYKKTARLLTFRGVGFSTMRA
jgi:hypothetical protein